MRSDNSLTADEAGCCDYACRTALTSLMKSLVGLLDALVPLGGETLDVFHVVEGVNDAARGGDNRSVAVDLK